uniref:Uncharacterized protein n=1 Tax=Rangifer tarandus platyrhynchus TaxID=3082113 RepID=A0ACB0E560_RANTA|nr:unnamed protein product [Rangifer tarandus platyrhynchus]
MRLPHPQERGATQVQGARESGQLPPGRHRKSRAHDPGEGPRVSAFVRQGGPAASARAGPVAAERRHSQGAGPERARDLRESRTRRAPGLRGGPGPRSLCPAPLRPSRAEQRGRSSALASPSHRRRCLDGGHRVERLRSEGDRRYSRGTQDPGISEKVPATVPHAPSVQNSEDMRGNPLPAPGWPPS